MAFVDELQLHLKAGHGGDGVVRWLHLKGKELSGPAGGNGGRGGNVRAKAVRDITILGNYLAHKQYAAGDGDDGQSRSKEGKNGEDFVLEVPIGTIIRNLDTGEEYELLEEGQEALLLTGGGGGHGNEHFKGSRNVTPMQSTPGKPGEEADFQIELQLVVDAGFIGFPNAGKSSLLNVLTRAQAKVGNYAFTTLSPNLGVLYGYILADIPGLISGASQGKGLGHTFLRHIKRTKVLLHCISCEQEDMVAAYQTIRTELREYSDELTSKTEFVLFTKTDLLSPDELTARMKEFIAQTAISPERLIAVSIYDNESLKHLTDLLTKYLGGSQ